MNYLNLTTKQMEIVRFIWRYRKLNGIAPTLSEIAEELGVSKITVHEHVSLLERKGALAKHKYQSRSLNLSDELLETLAETEKERARVEGHATLQLLGSIAAGKPIEALENPETLDIAEALPLGKTDYVLRVRGDSMIDDGIRDGDLVLVERRTNPSNGETVVAIIGDNEATLKRFYREKKGYRLQPANETLEPILVDRVEVRGVVTGVLRKY